MTFSAPSDGHDDLTRTTLQIEGSMSKPSIAQLVQALQRVPGVLLAEINAASARAIVAHDAAVPLAALVAAVAGAGGHAEIVADPRRPAVRADLAPRFNQIPLRRLVTFVAALFVMVAIVDVLVPVAATKHWLLPLLLSVFWIFFLAQALAARRR